MSKLLFICGFPSGGTELTKTILNAHPGINICDEMPWLKDIVRYGYDENTVFDNIDKIMAFQKRLGRLDLWRSIENRLHDFSAALKEKGKLSLEEVLRVCCNGDDVKVWGSKTPQFSENMDTLMKLFPNALFLVVVRDVRDVCLSWNKKWGKDMIWCAAKWSERMMKAKCNAENLLKNRSLFVKFEDLVSDTYQISQRICRFLDVPFSNQILEPHKHTLKLIDGKMNYGRPIKKDNFNKWREEVSIKMLERIEAIAYETMQVLEYEIEYAKCKRSISFKETWRGKWHDSWAMLTVGNRYKKKNSLWDRLRDIRNLVYWRSLKR